MSSQAMGLFVIGSILIVVGLFLPAATCDASGMYYCNKDNIALFQSDYFKDPYEFSDGINAHFFPIMLVVMCLVVLTNASQDRGVFPVTIALFGILAFYFFLIWDEIDRSSALSVGFAWIVLFLGAGLILWGGYQTRARRHNYAAYAPASGAASSTESTGSDWLS